MFFSRKEYHSEKNGTIAVEKILGTTNIIVDNCFEAGPYLITMWKRALKKLPKNYAPKNALILGLGGGNIIALLQANYPGIKITIIEWDDVMIAVAKELKLFKLTPEVRISNRDAYEAVQRMSERFDCIFVDLFTGPVPPLFLGDRDFICNVAKLLKDDGYLFLNVYRHLEYLEKFKSSFSEEEIWKFRLNTLGLYRHKGKGRHDAKIPAGFSDIRQAENYLRGLFSTGEVVRAKGILGIRQKIGPLCAEYYTSDEEPTPEPYEGMRLVIWDRVTSDHKPTGWHAMLPGVTLSTVVISDLKDGEYWKSWSETARRYRSQWSSQTSYEMVPIDLDTFKKHYMVHGRPKNTRATIIGALSYRLSVDQEHVRIFGVREKATGALWGGMAVVDAPSASHSYYLFAFLDKEHAPTQAGHWMIIEWLKTCREQGIRFANFGPVWTPGEQKSWKGFTEFKQHFRPFPLTYKPPLFRFTFSWKLPKGEKAQG